MTVRVTIRIEQTGGSGCEICEEIPTALASAAPREEATHLLAVAFAKAAKYLSPEMGEEATLIRQAAAVIRTMSEGHS